jgi:radical SAM protein with 4Fe4S-binding SPASM domain
MPELQVVSLYMDGEPILDKKIVDRVKRCKDLGLPHIGFSSNASLLTRDKSAALLEAGLDWIAISFDSLDKTSYEKVRRALNHDKVLANIHALIEERDKTNNPLEIALRYLNHPDNTQSFEEYSAYWKQYLRDTDKLVNVHCHNWGEETDSPQTVSTQKCAHPFNNMVVLSDGTVPLCCVDYNAEMPMGSLAHQTLSEIWNGKAFKDVRELHEKGQRAQISRCKYCTV